VAGKFADWLRFHPGFLPAREGKTMFSPKFGRQTMLLAAFCASLAATPIRAEPETTDVEIGLVSFKFRPAVIQLEHGRDYVLHFVNSSNGGHDFTAQAFFDAAKIAPEDRAKLNKGSVELEGGEDASIHLTAPAPGRYKVHCSHFMHATLGMTGEIVVG
jgi:plastocyanin